MKAILEFALPEEQHEHRMALDAHKWRSVVVNAAQSLRARLKYQEHSGAEVELIERIYQDLFEDMRDMCLNLYDE